MLHYFVDYCYNNNNNNGNNNSNNNNNDDDDDNNNNNNKKQLPSVQIRTKPKPERILEKDQNALKKTN